MNDAAVHPRKCFLVDVPPGDNRAARDVTAAERLRQGNNVRLQVPMLEPEHFSSAPEPGLHFIGNEQRAVLATEFLRANEEIGLRSLAALALNGLNHERGHIARTQFPIQFFDVVERYSRS